MDHPKIYALFPGTARGALTFYQSIFGGELELFTYAQFGREDGPADALAHGILSGEVSLYAADAGKDEVSVSMEGIMLSILGGDPPVLREWFARLAEGGAVLDPLQRRAWGDWDGQLRDRFGLRWLIGFKDDEASGSGVQDPLHLPLL